MEYTAHTDATADALERVYAAVAAGPLDVPVPTCPDFDVRALTLHIAAVASNWTHALRDGAPASDELAAPADGLTPQALSDWLRTVGDELIAALRATPPDTERWTWYAPDQTSTFIARRLAHELTIHRVDMQLSRGQADPIPPALASDGIEEAFVLQAYVASVRTDIAPGSGRTMHLHGTDVPTEDSDAPITEWLVTLGVDGVTVEHEHAKGDLAVRGAIGDLELTLYQRPTDEPVQTFGDESVLDEFHKVFTL